MELTTVNSGQWKPGQSRNLNGRPVGSRHQFSGAFLRDLAEVWQAEGRGTMLHTAKNTAGYFLCCLRSPNPERCQADGRTDICRAIGRGLCGAQGYWGSNPGRQQSEPAGFRQGCGQGCWRKGLFAFYIPRNLPFRVEMSDQSDQRIRWVIAASASVAVGQAAMDAAIAVMLTHHNLKRTHWRSCRVRTTDSRPLDEPHEPSRRKHARHLERA
jgi:hypothetical protein